MRAARVALLIGCIASISPAAAQKSHSSGEGAVAVVDGVSIASVDVEQALAVAVREKFYHRRPSEEALAALRREVTDKLIDRTLLVAEARRRGLVPDSDKVRATLAAVEQRNAGDPEWRRVRETTLPRFARWLEDQSVLEQLESRVRDVGPMGETELRGFYDAHATLFTEPEQMRLSVILLKVDPAAPRPARDAALEEAQALLRRLRNGADFAELARLHSGDAASAAKGGDLGYLHRGLLPEGLQRQIDSMRPGTLSEPVALLEGVALFRLEERRPERLRDYDDVRQRVSELARREAADLRWKRTVSELRARAVVEKSGAERLP